MTSLFKIILQPSYAFLIAILHKIYNCNMRLKGISQKVQGFHTYWHNCGKFHNFFFFLQVSYAGFILKWGQPQLWYKQFNFLWCQNFSLLLGSISNTIHGTPHGSHGVYSRFTFYTKHNEKHTRNTRDYFWLQCASHLLGKWNAHSSSVMISITWCFQ